MNGVGGGKVFVSLSYFYMAFKSFWIPNAKTLEFYILFGYTIN